MLFTFHVTSGTHGYVEQSEADDWTGAQKALLASEGFQQFIAMALPSTAGAPIVDADVFMMIPMMGLKHCWSMQGGREGEYFSALVIRTDDAGEIEQPCDHE